MYWNYRLLKEIEKDDVKCERVRFVETYYLDDHSLIGFGVVTKLVEYAEENIQEGPFDINKLTFKPIDEEKVKKYMRNTLNDMLEGLKKPILTVDDFPKKDTISKR